MRLTIVLMLVFLCGCARIVVTKPDGTVLQYTRWGNQEIDAFIMEKDGSVLLERQKSDNTILYEAINKLVDKVP
jgi:hypothetical protein